MLLTVAPGTHMMRRHPCRQNVHTHKNKQHFKKPIKNKNECVAILATIRAPMRADGHTQQDSASLTSLPTSAVHGHGPVLLHSRGPQQGPHSDKSGRSRVTYWWPRGRPWPRGLMSPPPINVETASSSSS